MKKNVTAKKTETAERMTTVKIEAKFNGHALSESGTQTKMPSKDVTFIKKATADFVKAQNMLRDALTAELAKN